MNIHQITIKKDKIGRRSVFSLEEYDKLVRFLRSYSSKKQCPDEALRNERLMVRDAVLYNGLDFSDQF